MTFDLSWLIPLVAPLTVFLAALAELLNWLLASLGIEA